MSKERLEEIKNVRWENLRTSQILHVKWLIEQAERVQELEENHKEYVSFTESNNYNMDIEFEKLYKQNKRYREELDILGEVINSAPNADKLNEEYERLKGLEGEE